MPSNPEPSSPEPLTPVAAAVRALARVPRLVLALLVGLCLLAGLFLPPPWSALLLVPVLAVLATLTAAAWPLLTAAQRGLRVVVLSLLVAAVASRVT